MKISLAWVCEYLNIDVSSIDIHDLVTRFNTTTAEIESYYHVTTDTSALHICRVTHVTQDTTHLYSPEKDKDIMLPGRSDVESGQWYLIVGEGDSYRWAVSTDLGARKTMSLPAIYVSDTIQSGSWKKQFEVQDWIIEIDNKSITNRPDLWAHYGIAREIAAIYNYTLTPFETLLASKDIVTADTALETQDGFSLRNRVPQACRRFAGLYFEYIEQRASLVWMVTRLSRIDSRAIDTLVDMTNYVMFDISQPLHAFDAHTLPAKTIGIQIADNKTKLELLDDQTVELTDNDLIITDGSEPIALAGIMGGKKTAVTQKTDSMFLEAACFDPTIIRKTSHRLGIRTHASARFEKSLDPNQNVQGIRRFLSLIYAADIDVKESDVILSLGARAEEKQVQVSHTFIEKRLGTTIASDFIVSILEKLGFLIEVDKDIYTITIPDYRASKDIALKEDIVEEVGRFYGYDTIPYIFPTRPMRPFSIASVMRTRAIKELMAYGLHMHEVQPYAFFDQSFLQQIKWEPTDALSVQNPVSGNWRQLVTSLLPNLFKVVVDHAPTHERLRFFEWGRTWSTANQVTESKVLSGIVYEQRNPLTFFMGKALLSHLFSLLEMDVTWISPTKSLVPWFDPAQTAVLMHHNTTIGTAGMTSSLFLEPLALGRAFVFELNGEYLLSFGAPTIRYQKPSKFPPVYRDISLFVPLACSVATLINTIQEVDDRIKEIDLEDYFEKEEWGDKRSITIRCTIIDSNKTLTKEDVDALMAVIESKLVSLGGEIR